MARSVGRNRFRRNEDSVSGQNFGELLKSTREKHGISISEVSRDLLVREDILVAIEHGDFNKIPPQGYSRNMIKSYARLLGLNANKVTDMFLDAEYSYQLNKKQATVQKISDENKKRVPHTPVRSRSKTMTPREQIEQRRLQEKENKVYETPAKHEILRPRTMHVYGRKYKNTPRARRELDIQNDVKHGRTSDERSGMAERDFVYDDNYKTARERLEERKRRNAATAYKQPVKDNPFSEDSSISRRASALNIRKVFSRKDSARLNEEEDPNNVAKTQRNKTGYQFMNVYHKKNNASQSDMTIPVVGIAVVVLTIALVLVFFVIGKQSENDKTDVSNLNVVGISDIEKNGNNQDYQNNEDTNNTSDSPKEVEFKYKVKPGQTVYMELYENNDSRPILARELKPGETNSFKVTGTLKVVTTQPDAVELYVANELVVPQDEKGNGVYTYVVDFNQYLQKVKTQSMKKQNNS